MTPDRDPGEAVLERDAARVAAGPLPTPRPEVLARVLEGLRELPTVARPTRDGASDDGDDPGLPLPRRRS